MEAGNITVLYKVKPFAPMVLAAFTYIGLICFTASTVAIVIAKVEPMAIKKNIARSFIPNQRIENGNQQILGSVWRPKITELRFSSRYLYLIIITPSETPKIIDNEYPINSLFKLAVVAIHRVPSIAIEYKEFATSRGDGNIYGFQIWKVSTASL